MGCGALVATSITGSILGTRTSVLTVVPQDTCDCVESFDEKSNEAKATSIFSSQPVAAAELDARGTSSFQRSSKTTFWVIDCLLIVHLCGAGSNSAACNRRGGMDMGSCGKWRQWLVKCSWDATGNARSASITINAEVDRRYSGASGDIVQRHNRLFRQEWPEQDSPEANSFRGSW